MRGVFRLGLLFSLFSGLLGLRNFGLPARYNPLLTKTDGFGYQMNDITSVTWEDATDGTKASISNPDVGLVGPVTIGFNFKFYENSYAQFYISPNGFIIFNAGNDDESNRPIPWNSLPNNFIAPFWDDLYVGGFPDSAVYTKLIGSTPGSRKLVIEWYRIVRYTESQELTFETILYENGDIAFLYYTLDGTLTRCTVGIENAEGLDGLQYVYYEPGLSVGKAIVITRPAPGRRVKLLPREMSSFAINGQTSFQLVVKNIGESGADTYNLQAAARSPGWSVMLSKSGGQTLQDTGSDGIPDTGPLAVGQTLTLSLQLKAPALAGIGDYTTAVFTATSVAQSSVWMTATAQAAVPGAFVQAYFDARGVQLHQVWEQNLINQSLGNYTGQALAVGNITNEKYIVAWERRSSNFTDVVYQIASRLGGAVQTPSVLTNSSALLQPPVIASHAQNPVNAKSSTGQVGVVWRQFLTRTDYAYNSNIRLAVLNSDGTLISERYNLINDTNFYSGTLNTHEYTSPFLAAGVNIQNQSRFQVCWVDIFRVSSNLGRKLACGVFSFTGIALTSDAQFDLETVSGSTVVNEPYLTNLSGDRVLIAYTRSTGTGSQIVYAVRGLDGSAVKAPTAVPGGVGDKVRALQFLNQDVLLVWRSAAGELQYIILDGTDYEPDPAGPKTLPKVANRSVDMLSVSLEQSGKAELTWVDAEENHYLYYLLLASDGTVVTPGMQFAFPILGTSSFGQGIASYLGVFQIHLPVVRK